MSDSADAAERAMRECRFRAFMGGMALIVALDNLLIQRWWLGGIGLLMSGAAWWSALPERQYRKPQRHWPREDLPPDTPRPPPPRAQVAPKAERHG